MCRQSVGRDNQQGHMRSLIDLLHEVPAVLEALPPEALKALSASCRSLRTSFCAQVKVISMSDAEDACRVCCMTWPQLLMVVCIGGSKLAKLSAQWEQTIEMALTANTMSACMTAVLVRPCQQVHTPLTDLLTQHATALSNFAEKHRHNTTDLSLRGPFVRCSAIQSLMQDSWPTLRVLSLTTPQLEAGSISQFSKSLPNLAAFDIEQCSTAALELLRSGTAWPHLLTLSLAHNQLDAKLISVMPQARWTQLRYLNLGSNMIGTAGVQHLVACSWPHLHILHLANTGIDEPALRCLAHGLWPALCMLDLTKNNIDAAGVSHLVQASWPQLSALMLSEQGLDECAYSLLSIEYPATEAMSQKSGLQQFPQLCIIFRS